MGYVADGRGLQQMAERCTDDELRLIVQFNGQMAEVIRQHITVLWADGGAG